MRRGILAIVAFNIYSPVLLSAFEQNTAYLFDPGLIKEMQLSGLDFSPGEWGWGNHYIWRIVAAVVVTALVGVLAGAIAQEGGARVATLANIPSVLVWIGIISILGFADVEVESRTGFIIVSLVAIPLTTYVAYLSGDVGEYIQNEFHRQTVLGIRGFHWLWIIFPVYWYSLALVNVCARLIGVVFATWSDASILASIVTLLMAMPIVAWVYPLLLAYRVLRGELLAKHHATVKAAANLGILILGMPIATGITFGIYWVLNKTLA
jgi:hypothetical protein